MEASIHTDTLVWMAAMRIELPRAHARERGVQRDCHKVGRKILLWLTHFAERIFLGCESFEGCGIMNLTPTMRLLFDHVRQRPIL